MRASVSQLSRSTQAPIGTIGPASSATGMNSAGGTSPSAGLFQRSSASTAASLPVSSSNTGWKASRELAAHLGAAQLADEREPPPAWLRRLPPKNAQPIPPGALGLVHRAVGLADRLARIRLRVGQQA